MNKKNIPLPTNFGKNLKFLRKKMGLTQGAFAEIIGISRNSIASYENGLVEPSAFNFLRVCKYFDMDPQEMLEEDLAAQASEEFQSEQARNEYLRTSLVEFSSETKEMAKVVEGYKEFYVMRKRASNNEGKEFFLILDDILELLGSLIKENQAIASEILVEGFDEEFKQMD